MATPPSPGELSSLETQITALALRISALMENPDGDRTDENSTLLEVERHLQAAQRELSRLGRQR
ncbi:MAG: hypothetical protein HN567_00380 [Actinobacteria bacterium]|jgi:hypothetical protein|nr:hypothetical protein [Actinomycetota bacterium]MBT3746518.1 hypothetical protein [Actinomycetota bacterium]MBT3969947.1 hypothetical protein [Actinomycetota bacterium]MBT4008975.1 hypothetical protein [Actinomycetota bacterium]MBT4303917.1 hypothetical protein [Actinomycetota bacterium]